MVNEFHIEQNVRGINNKTRLSIKHIQSPEKV